MLEKLKILKDRFDELSDLLTKPDIISDQSRYIKISKEYKDLKTVIDKKNEYEEVLSNISEAKEIIKNENDKEMIELANLELNEAQAKVVKIEDDLKKLLIPTMVIKLLLKKGKCSFKSCVGPVMESLV